VICKYCKGEGATHTRPVAEFVDVPPQPGDVNSAAIGVWRACPGGNWCDCQHRDTPVARLYWADGGSWPGSWRLLGEVVEVSSG